MEAVVFIILQTRAVLVGEYSMINRDFISLSAVQMYGRSYLITIIQGVLIEK